MVLREGKIEDHSRINYIKLRKLTCFGLRFFTSKNRAKFELPSINHIYNLLKDNKPNFMVIRNDSTLAFLPVLILGKFFKIKIILYNQYPKYKPTLRMLIYNKLFYIVFRVKTITPVLKKNFANNQILSNENPEQYKFRLENSLMYNKRTESTIWVPFTYYPKYPLTKADSDDIIKIIAVGKIQKRKNLDKVILLLIDFAKTSRYNFELTIVGEKVDSELGYLPYLESLSNTTLKNLKINILTNLNHNETLKIYTQASVFILLSEKEIASVSQLEAFAAGCKILVFFDNGNLDFLPIDSSFQKIHDFVEFSTKFEIILKSQNSKYQINEYYKIYDDLCGGINGVKRFLDLF
jgi:glycosyltransferase involved in cell wall biosynthesis